MSALDNDRTTTADFLDVMLHGRPSAKRSRDIRDYANGRIRFSVPARELYSYGTHFPLLRYVPRGRRRPLIVLNGDEWRGSNSRTSDHQRIARDLSREIADTVVIPFSALDGAGLDIDSIRPLAVRDDARWEETVTVDRLARVPRWMRTHSVSVDRTAATLEAVPDGSRKRWQYLNGTHEYRDIPRAEDGLFHW